MRTGLRLATGGVLVAIAVLGGAGTAAAQTDPVFDPADADELANVLAEAAEGQDVCYGWDITVSDNASFSDGESRGSNDGAGTPVDTTSAKCADYVVFRATITYTSESSESEDSASYSVDSSSPDVTTEDLDSLELISDEGLVGDNADVDVAKAVAALPQLAADAGIAQPIEATPAAEGEAGDAQLTDDPGSDFWRQTGMVLVWGGLLMVAGVVFGIYAFRSSRRERYVSAETWARPAEPAPPETPAYVPPEWFDDSVYRAPAPKSTSDPTPAADPEPPTEPVPAAEESATPEVPEPTVGSAADAERADEPVPAEEPAALEGSEPAAGSAADAERADEPAPAEEPGALEGSEPAAGSAADAERADEPAPAEEPATPGEAEPAAESESSESESAESESAEDAAPEGAADTTDDPEPPATPPKP
jgi:hypothetical protein